MHKKLLGLAALAVLSNPLMADDRWSVNGGLYFYMFDNDRLVDDDIGYGVNVEKRFGDLGVRFGVQEGDTDFTPSSDRVDLLVLQLDGLMYLEERGSWQPYLLGGVAHADFDRPNHGGQEAQLSAGGGTRFAFDDNWHWWVEARAVLGIDSDRNGDGVFATGIGYSFGEKSKPAQPAPAPAAPPRDSDGDGVIDERDECPGTPRGVAVDSVGCPLDSDGDGVADYLDRCPGTPAGVKVDELGCNDVVQEVTLRVQFATNSDVVTDQYISEIKDVADFLKQYPRLTVSFEGHTDSQGDDSYNQALSQRRAASVASVLVQRFGIDPSRVKSEGFGEARPIASNDTADGRARNRRVVAVVRTTVQQ